MAAFIDITGRIFGRWTALSFRSTPRLPRGTRVHWLCRCECGEQRYVDASSLLAGTSHGCSRCGAKEQAAKRRKPVAEKKARYNAYRKRWLAENPDKKKALSESQKRWSQGVGHAKRKASARKWRMSDAGREAVRRRDTERDRATGSSYKKAKERYWKTPKGKECCKRRRARARNVPSDLTALQWQLLCAWYDGCCAYCGKACAPTQDHIVPLDPGPHTLSNVIPACLHCNGRKHRRSLEVFAGPERAKEVLLRHELAVKAIGERGMLQRVTTYKTWSLDEHA